MLIIAYLLILWVLILIFRWGEAKEFEDIADLLVVIGVFFGASVICFMLIFLFSHL